MKYTKEALETIVAEGDGTILDTYDRYNQRMRVRFRCSCGAETSKRFEMLNLYRLPYCEPCSLKKATERSKATIMKNYGVENAGQAECVKKKIKDIFRPVGISNRHFSE